jgi:hypothetical protein
LPPKAIVAPAPKEAVRPAASAKPAADAEGALGPIPLNLFRSTTTGAIVAFAGLALGLIAAFALARRREHAKDAGRRRRDISALSLDGKHARASTARPSRGPHGRPARSPVSDAAPSPALAATAEATARSVAASEFPDWGDRMPRTREEALEVLGIGIAPSATETAIKKIVDGLRMSWHPDLAKDEIDRALREQRSKQINAAWEILQGQRAAV